MNWKRDKFNNHSKKHRGLARESFLKEFSKRKIQWEEVRINKGFTEAIPEEIVENIWQEVAEFSPNKAKKEVMKIRKSRAELLTFMIESGKKMSREVRELAIYMLVVVCRMLQKAHGKIKKISSEEVIKCHEHNESLMEGFEGLMRNFLIGLPVFRLPDSPMW